MVKEREPRCSRPRKRHSPNCDCATVTDEKLIRDLESMLSIIDHPSHAWVQKLVAPLVTRDRKRAKALYRKHIGMVDMGPRLPPPSQRCVMCRYEKRVCRRCKCCDGCCEHRRTRRQKALRAAAAKTQMLKEFAKKHGVLIVTAIQGKPLTSQSLMGSIIAPKRQPKRKPKPKLIEIEGIWSDGEVTSKVLFTDGITCSTGVADSYIRGQRHSACKAKLWLVRFFNDGKLVREWDAINRKYHLELD